MEVRYLCGTVKQQSGVSRIAFPENYRRRGQRGGGFSGDVGSGVSSVDFVDTAKRVHVLGPFPAVMVGVSVSNLDENDAGDRRRFEEVVSPPPHGSHGVFELGSHGSPEIDYAPRQHCRRERHRETELDVVSGVVVTAR